VAVAQKEISRWLKQSSLRPSTSSGLAVELAFEIFLLWAYRARVGWGLSLEKALAGLPAAFPVFLTSYARRPRASKLVWA